MGELVIMTIDSGNSNKVDLQTEQHGGKKKKKAVKWLSV